MGPPGPAEAWRLTGLQVEFINPIFEFSRGMRGLQLDDAEYALLIAIDLFSGDRPGVQHRAQVEALQLPYVEALRAYTRIQRPQVRWGPHCILTARGRQELVTLGLDPPLSLPWTG